MLFLAEAKFNIFTQALNSTGGGHRGRADAYQTPTIHSSEINSIKICELRMRGYSVCVVYCTDKYLEVFTSVYLIRWRRWSVAG